MRFASIVLTWLFLLPCWLQAADLPSLKREFYPVYAAKVGPPYFFLEHHELQRPRVGLALSGGGARCLAQVGVLLAFEENAIPIDFIAGTSMGSVIGGLYAAGYSARQIMEIAKQIRWSDLMVDTPPRNTLFVAQKAERDRSYLQMRFNGFKPYIPPALTAGQKLMSILTDLTMRANYRASANFDNLRIPFRAVATDLYSGREIVIADGELAEAMRASVAVPLLFTPVPRDSMLLLDGGLVDNIPVTVVRRQNIDLVIAVDTTSKLRDPAQLTAPWEVADQVTSIMRRDHNEAQRRAADLLIVLEDEKRISMDFSNPDSLFDAGYRAALAKMDELQAKLLSTTNDANPAMPAQDEWLMFDRYYVNGAASRWPHNWRAQHFTDNGTPRLRLRTRDIQALLMDYYHRGDYAAVRAVWTPDSTGNALHLELVPNPPLNAVTFSGNTVHSDSTLLRRLRSPLGQPINHQRSREDLEAIIELYRSAGYALAEIRHVLYDKKSGELNIDIDEGYIAEIAIEGCRRTKPLVIRREFPLNPGDIFDSNRSARGIQNIHSLGLFDRVALNVTRRARSTYAETAAVEATAVVHIKLQEKPSRLARIGARYDTERAGRLWFEFGDENTLGIASKLFGLGVVGARENAALLSWRVDRLFKTYLNLSAQARYRYAKNLTYGETQDSIGEYEDERYGLFLSLGQQVRRFGAATAELDLSNIRLNGVSGTGYPVGKQTINTLTFRSVVDTQDRMPFARRGRYVHLAYAMAFTQLQSEPPFFKFFARLESSTTLRKRHTLRPRFMAGTSEQSTPYSEQYRIGGPEEMYGLHDQELVGRHFVLLSLEYRYRFPTKFIFDTYLSPRVDFGAVWRERSDVNYKKFRRALGVALAWDTPMGPILFAVGKTERRSHRFYVTVGYRF